MLPPAAKPNSTPFESAITPKTRGRMRLNQTAPRHLVNREFAKRLTIPSLRVADQILMDLLIEQKSAGIEALDEEEEEEEDGHSEDEDDGDGNGDDAELIIFDDEESLSKSDCDENGDDGGASSSGLLQSDCINTPNVMLSDLDSNSPRNGHHGKYGDAPPHGLSNDDGSGGGLKIAVSRWRESGSSTSTHSPISKENEQGNDCGMKAVNGMSNLLRSASAEFDGNMQSSQSFTDEELRSILQREGPRQSSIARKSRLTAADSVILVATELLDTELTAAMSSGRETATKRTWQSMVDTVSIDVWNRQKVPALP